MQWITPQTKILVQRRDPTGRAAQPAYCNLVQLIRFLQQNQPQTPVKVPFRRTTNKPTLILDLDQTMIFASPNVLDERQPDSVFIDSQGGEVYIYKRPFVEFFFEHLINIYEIIAFTSGRQRYAEHIINLIDPEQKYIKALYTRKQCTTLFNFFIKDLSILDIDLSRAVILDDSLVSFSFHVDNGILIEAWTGDPNDMSLLRMTPFMKDLANSHDIRQAIRGKTTVWKYIHEQQ